MPGPPHKVPCAEPHSHSSAGERASASKQLWQGTAPLSNCNKQPAAAAGCPARSMPTSHAQFTTLPHGRCPASQPCSPASESVVANELHGVKCCAGAPQYSAVSGTCVITHMAPPAAHGGHATPSAADIGDSCCDRGVVSLQDWVKSGHQGTCPDAPLQEFDL
jgi:hypothetical protein